MPKSPPPADDKQQFNVYLSTELVRRVKYLALDRQQSLSDLVREALEAHLRKHQERS
jgi:predicted DNA-binding protein